MPERDGERDHLRPAPPGNALEIANQLGEQVIRIEFVDDQLEECTRPLQLCRVRCEQTQRPWTKLLAPPLSVEFLLGSSGVFEESIDVERKIVDLAHAQTSRMPTRTAVSNWQGAWAARSYGVGVVMSRGDVPA
jgi:hypothetical protein